MLRIRPIRNLLAALWFTAALKTSRCFSRSVSDKSVSLVVEIPTVKPQRSTRIKAYLAHNTYLDAHTLHKSSCLGGYAAARTAPTSAALRLSHSLHESRSNRGDGEVRLGTGSKGFLLPATNFRPRCMNTQICRTRTKTTSTAVRRLHPSSEAAPQISSTLPPHKRIHARRTQAGTLFDCQAIGAVPSSLETRACHPQEEPLQSPERNVSRLYSADTPKGKTEESQRHPVRARYADMLIRQIQESNAFSSDALKFAFPKRTSRMTFRQCVLSKLRQRAIRKGLGVVNDFDDNEALVLLDSCLKPSTSDARIPLEEERSAERVTLENKERSVHHSAVVCSTRDGQLINGWSNKSPLRFKAVYASECTVIPSTCASELSNAFHGLKPVAAAHADGGVVNGRETAAHGRNLASKGPQPMTRQSHLLPCRVSGGRTYSATQKRTSIRRQTASESLRKELGLQRRSDIMVHHVSDFQCPQKRPRVPQMFRKRKPLQC